MIFRRVSVAEMLHLPSLVPRLAKNHEWPRWCGTPVREARCLAGVRSIALRLSPLAACKSPLLQVAVAAIRGWRSLSYQAEISRTSPTAIVMVMDQSASMNHRLKSGQSKAAFLTTVLHVTDGHPSDGNPEPIADRLKSLATDDGACLLFNLHVDAGDGEPLIFPNDERVIQDRFGKSLFRMSSLLPPHALEAAAAKGYDVRPGARGFVFNAGIEAIADFFDIGTRPAIAADR